MKITLGAAPRRFGALRVGGNSMTTTARLRSATKPTTELRLALVCYGGVSLAVYMHGITKELHKLICAARAFDKNPKNNPFPDEDRSRLFRCTAWHQRDRRPQVVGEHRHHRWHVCRRHQRHRLEQGPRLQRRHGAIKGRLAQQGDIRQLLRGYSKVPLAPRSD